MSPRRPTLLLLGVLSAALAVPAAAHAAVPTNTTPAPPAGGWVKSGYVVTPSGTDGDGDPITQVEWDLNDGNGPVTGAPGSTVVIPARPLVQLTTRVEAGGEWSSPRNDTYNVDDAAPLDQTSPNATWYPGPADIPLVGDADGTSPIVKFQYRLDANPVPTDTVGLGPWTVSVVADGLHTLWTKAFDLAGNESAWKSTTVRIDSTLPTDTTAVSSAWSTTAPVVVNVTGADAHSGIARVRWRVGTSGAFTEVVGTTTPASISGDGIRTLQTQVVDAAGHAGAITSHQVRIDTTAPSNLTDAAPAGWRDGTYQVMVRGADDGSQVARVEWSVDGSGFSQGSPPLQATVSGHGSHTLTTRVWDNAGNSTERDETIQIDMVDPVNTTAVPPGGAQNNPYTLPVTGTDSGSGLQKVEWKVDGGSVQSGASGAQATITGHGIHTLETRVVDQVGRTSGWRMNTVNIDAITNDTVDPVDTTTTAPAGWRPAPISVTVAATDDGSGVAELQWRLDGNAIQVSPGANPTFSIATEGEHLLETRAIDVKGNDTEWRAQTFKVDLSVPSDTTALVDGAWRDSRSFELSGTDAHSGIRWIDFSVDGAPTQHGTNHQVVNLPSDGTFTVVTRAIDHAGHASALRTSIVKVDSADPVNTTPVADSDWVNVPLSLVPAGTDAGGSGVAAIEWRVDGGEVQDESPIVIDEDGEHLLETRVVDHAGNATPWRQDTVKIDRTAPANTTAPAPAGWRSTPYTVAITGDDGDGSGLDIIERTIDGGAVSNDPNVTISGDGVHTLRSRITDLVGFDSGWRDDIIRIDSVAPTAQLACGAAADVWSAAPVSCTVTADGGPSGLGSLTLAGADGGTATVASGAAATVSADGTHVLQLDAVDGAGNHAAAEATVNVDRTAPDASLSCTAGERTYTCRADASDATSGLAALGWSADGELKAIGAGQTFTVAKGSVQLRAADAAGNVNLTAPHKLAAIPVGATVRITSAPVYLKGGKTPDNMLGALKAVRSATGTVSLDLRPLAIGRGSYRVEIVLKSGKRSRKVKRDYKVGRTGTLPRMGASLSKAVGKTTVTLTVRKRVGGHWRSHAGARLVVAK
jgi:hypothetical protein